MRSRTSAIRLDIVHAVARTLGMRAVVYEKFGGPLEMRDVATPATPPDGVVIRVRATGICRSDWHGWMGHDPDVRPPHVPGHELAGEIAEIGREVRLWRAGDRVTVPFAVGCGRCRECYQGNPHICDDYFQPGFTGWGSFAELVAIPHADFNLVRLPEGMDMVSAASLGCRFGTAFQGLLEQGGLRAGEWLVVFGCGGVGLAAIMIGRAIGARCIGVDINPKALKMACELGAEQVLDARIDPVVDAIRETTQGGADVSLDALGSGAACRQSLASLRKRGRHVQVGLMAGPERDPAIPMHLVIARELQLRGSHGMPAQAYPRMIEMILEGKLDPKRLVRKRINLDEAAGGLTGMGQFGTLGMTVIDRF